MQRKGFFDKWRNKKPTKCSAKSKNKFFLHLFCISLILHYLCTRFCGFVCRAEFINIINYLFIDQMNQYETVFILTPVLSEAQVKEAADKYKDYLVQHGAEIINEENWGMKKLAYSIQKKSSGFYLMIEYKAEPTVIAKYELQMRRDERVLRYLTVKNEKYAAAYAEKRRNKKEA